MRFATYLLAVGSLHISLVARAQEAPPALAPNAPHRDGVSLADAPAFEYRSGGTRLSARCELPVYYLAGETRTDFQNFLRLSYFEQNRPVADAVGLADAENKARVTLDSDNRDLLTVEVDPKRGIGLTFKKAGNVNLLVTFPQGNVKLPIEIIDLPVRLGASRQRIVEKLGEPTEKTPVKLQQGQSLVVDRIEYSAPTLPVTLEHWRFRKFPGLVAAIQDDSLVEVSTVAERPRFGPRILPPEIDAKQVGAEAIKEYDADKNGFIDGEELTRAASIKSSLEKIDLNSDKRVSAEEVESRVNAWKASKIGIMSLSCRVRLDGQPLEGATVTFVPEKFLGNGVKPAKGVTGPGGTAMLTVDDPDLAAKRIAGAACGLYRVEIEAPGKNIPARYNKQTTLGEEVAMDARWVQPGLTFELKSD